MHHRIRFRGGVHCGGPREATIHSLQVAVVDEHEIFRRGLVASLTEEPQLDVVFNAARGPITSQAQIAVVSPQAAAQETFPCPLIVCSSESQAASNATGNTVMGVLPRSTLTSEMLAASVRAAAAGLRVDPPAQGVPGLRLDERRLEVLRLLAQGADTHEISGSLQFAERTVKTLIHEIQQELGARSRAQAVALGIRRGLI